MCEHAAVRGKCWVFPSMTPPYNIFETRSLTDLSEADQLASTLFSLLLLSEAGVLDTYSQA